MFAFLGLGLASHRLGRWTYVLMVAVILIYIVYAYVVPPSLATTASH